MRAAYGTVLPMYRKLLVTSYAMFLLVAGAASARPAHAADGSWPVGPPRPLVVRGWDPPASTYGRGHRGVDLAAPPGTPVRAAAAGRISFAGQVAGRGVVAISLTGTGDPPLRTTYEPVEAALPVGTEVSAGQVVGTVEAAASHCEAGCLHWGLLRGEEYLDPLSLLPPWLLARPPSRLLPVFGVPPLESAATPPPEPAAARAMVSTGALHAALLLVTTVLMRGTLRRGTRRAGRRTGRRAGRQGAPDGRG